jgi:hypothetical protein
MVHRVALHFERQHIGQNSHTDSVIAERKPQIWRVRLLVPRCAVLYVFCLRVCLAPCSTI